MALIGSNGSGKTTLARCTASLEQPDAGCFKFEQSGESAFLRPGLDVGVVLQGAQPWQRMTVSQNLMLPLQRVRGLTVTEAKERVQITLRAFGLDDRSESVAGSLSGGLKQRLMLARALGLEPKFLILDEVTSAMDAEWTERIRLHLLQYRQEYGATIVLISHQLNFVRRVATSVAYLANGKLIEYGAASNVLENPSSVSLQQFLMNA